MLCFIFQTGLLVFAWDLPQTTILLAMPSSWDYKHIPSYPTYILKGGGLTNFMPRLALNCYPVDLCLPSSWDYRYEPPCPVLREYF
jgi:hypothetical protein